MVCAWSQVPPFRIALGGGYFLVLRSSSDSASSAKNLARRKPINTKGTELGLAENMSKAVSARGQAGQRVSSACNIYLKIF